MLEQEHIAALMIDNTTVKTNHRLLSNSKLI